MINSDFYSILYKKFSDLNFSKLTEKEKKDLNKLKKLKINCIFDLLYYFPRDYDYKTNLKKICEISNNEYVVIKATVNSLVSTYSSNSKNLIKAVISDNTGFINLTWFSSPYVLKSLKINEEYYFIGTVKEGYGFQMINPEYKKAEYQSKFDNGGEIIPIYSTTKDISQNNLKKIIKIFFINFKNLILENIPEEIIKKFNLLNRIEALENMHFPKNQFLLEESKKRFRFEELLVLEMGIMSTKYQIDSKNHEIYKLEDKKGYVKNFLSSLHFSLTNAQKKVITEIYKELSSGKITNRLIQGDVGSGKTIVSMILLIYMAENSYQGVIMAPTEILATQHFLSHKNDFDNLGLKAELLTGSLSLKNKRIITDKIKNGEIDIVVGTHALIQENVEFKKLGLIVIDEQHRFGVEQRKNIRDKGVLANLIVMSATPIPRSLALSIYGDLDISIIDELPPGRKVIKTKHISSDEDILKMYTFINKKLNEGRQAYFIAPLIEESDKFSIKSVIELEEEVKKFLPNFKIGILHGKMNSKEKDFIMKNFKEKKLDIIVSTTVIEVGVNVPNASIIVIDNAERFGLSSLHQLRGRVGRGEHQSYCFLIAKTENETSLSRMKIMEETIDGFKIAEEDLRLRKPGEIFGTRQHGLADLKLVDVVNDIKLIKLVKDECQFHLEKNNGIIKNTSLNIDIFYKFKLSIN